MTVLASVRSYLGIAKESTKGTVVAPTDFIPVSQDSLKAVDNIDPLYDAGLRGSNVVNYNYIPGRTNSTVDFSSAVFADTVGYALAGVMGSVATTGSTAPYTHTISLKNATATGSDAQPISYTLTDYYVANVRSYPGCQFSDFSLKFNADGMLTYDTKATGWLSSAVATPTPTFSSIVPTPVWQGTVSIGAVTISNGISGNIDLKRNVTPIYGIAQTQNPYQVFLGGLEVSGKITFVMEADTELTRYLTNTQPAIVLNWAYGAAAAAVQIQCTLTKGAYTAAVIERGDDMVQISVDINGMGNSTDAGSTGGFAPIKWVLQNAKVANTYA
jgi:hypothetical protein